LDKDVLDSYGKKKKLEL